MLTGFDVPIENLNSDEVWRALGEKPEELPYRRVQPAKLNPFPFPLERGGHVVNVIISGRVIGRVPDDVVSALIGHVRPDDVVGCAISVTESDEGVRLEGWLGFHVPPAGGWDRRVFEVWLSVPPLGAALDRITVALRSLARRLRS